MAEPRLVALLSFYDEPPELLAQCLAGVELLGCEHVVAIDGAYALYPDAKPRSEYKQRAMIDYACHDMGIGCTLVTPPGPWQGNEVEKRTKLFEYGLMAAEEGDWFVVLDADNVMIQVPEDLRERLAETDCEVATVVWREVTTALRKLAGNPDVAAPEWISIRSLFRAQPIRVEGNHFTYVAGDGRVLWGESQEVEALKLTDLIGEHRRNRRSAERWHAQGGYYHNRDHSGLRAEVKPCHRCGGEHGPSILKLPTDWHMGELEDGTPWPLATGLLDFCRKCGYWVEKENRKKLKELGVRGDVKITQRYVATDDVLQVIADQEQAPS